MPGHRREAGRTCFGFIRVHFGKINVVVAAVNADEYAFIMIRGICNKTFLVLNHAGHPVPGWGNRMRGEIKIPGEIRVKGIGWFRTLGNGQKPPVPIHQQDALPGGLRRRARIPVGYKPVLIEVAREIHIQVREHDFPPSRISLYFRGGRHAPPVREQEGMPPPKRRAFHHTPASTS